MNDNERQILEQFQSISKPLQDWGSAVDAILTKQILTTFEQGFVKMVPVARLKTERSYLSKALYRKKSYKDPLLEIEDKVATRVVLLKSDDIARAADLILSYEGWNAKMTKNLKDKIEDEPKIFDYQSCHVVVWPKEDMGEVPAAYLTCEIQIRTLLQHAFAEVSHDSTYKGPYRNDAEILRHLAKSMALMEATDDYFCKIFSLMSDEKKQFSAFLKELMGLFKTFEPGFDKSALNFDVNDRLFELLLYQPVHLQDLEAFAEKHKNDLKRAIRPKNGMLFTQPVIILVAFYLFTHQSFLRQHWPLNQESLIGVYKAFNFSFAQY